MLMHIGVIGAGSWGTTLAVVLNENGHAVTLWSYSVEDAESMRSTRRNAAYLPDLPIPERIHITTDLAEASCGKDLLVLATPAQHLRGILRAMDPGGLRRSILVNVAKGIETDTLFRMSEVVGEIAPDNAGDRYAILSGPSHAEEVSARKATSVVAASKSPAVQRLVQHTFMTPYLRVYTSSDVVGVELGGAVKNVIAIGAGICDGAGFGDNTKAALITRGIAEIRRLGIAFGAEPHTFSGLSGLGDLIVTTMSRHSRNRFVGEEIGKGRPLPEILASMNMVAEGVATTRAARDLARAAGVEMPITEQVHRILFDGITPEEAVTELMMRQAKDETW
ncbi:MAG: NAD(P)H-dependent glycerol-3-phosphate dehydrogenase [Bacteroidota bacterium]|nr:NAD(P)H-dependent glycerol-3-phosphate dehydrogenase [Bacteroidota bacterium]